MRYHNIGNLIMCQYLLEIPDGYMAIDTGYAGGFRRYAEHLKKKQIDIKDIKYLFLTHAHDDHAGFLSELLSASNAALIADRIAPERLLAGRNPMIGGCSGRLAKAFVGFMKVSGKGAHDFPPYKVTDRAIIWDRFSQPLRKLGIRADIISLPGHTADSIGLLTDDKQLFCGDAAMNGFPGIHKNIIWIENRENYSHSWDVMIHSGAERMYPSHGAPFPMSDLIRYRGKHDKLKLL